MFLSYIILLEGLSCGHVGGRDNGTVNTACHLLWVWFVFSLLLFMDEAVNKVQYGGNILTTVKERIMNSILNFDFVYTKAERMFMEKSPFLLTKFNKH